MECRPECRVNAFWLCGCERVWHMYNFSSVYVVERCKGEGLHANSLCRADCELLANGDTPSPAGTSSLRHQEDCSCYIRWVIIEVCRPTKENRMTRSGILRSFPNKRQPRPWNGRQCYQLTRKLAVTNGPTLGEMFIFISPQLRRYTFVIRVMNE